MQQKVSKSQFKAQALEYLREVEKQKQPLVITHSGKPVAKIIPYKEEAKVEDILKDLRGMITYYENPSEPVGEDDWEVLK